MSTLLPIFLQYSISSFGDEMSYLLVILLNFSIHCCRWISILKFYVVISIQMSGGIACLPFCFILFYYFLKFIYYLFLAVLGLCFCARAFSSCGKRGPLFITVRGPLTIAASLVAEHRLQARRLSSCGSRAQLLRGVWDLPRPVLEPVSPALAGGLSTTAPPGKPMFAILNQNFLNHHLYQ